MYCSKCGEQNAPNDNYCKKCGESLKLINLENVSVNNINSNSSQINKNKLGVISLILGIISFFTSLIFIIAMPISITGLVLGIKSKVKDAISKIGIVLNIIGLTLTVIFSIIGIFILLLNSSSDNTTTNTYYGDEYSLKYDKNWSITTLYGGQEAFKYKNEESYLVPIGNSALSDSTSNFETTLGQKELYQTFYDYWNNDSSNSDTLKIYSGSNGFSKLIDDIYYATYNYGVTATQLKGKYILLVSVKQNAVLSFMTNSSENVENTDRKALELLKNIDIYEQANLNYDNDLYNFLDSLSNWNRYSNLRTQNLGNIKSINGGWRILSESETYWKFENGQFWWYKSIYDLDDNYWYGKTQILTGKEGLKIAGIDEDKLDTIVSHGSGKVTENDVYTIICTPTKIISGGVDKSDTNIPENATWTYVWILVDHKDEGIEAQVLNTESYDISYYFKITD